MSFENKIENLRKILYEAIKKHNVNIEFVDAEKFKKIFEENSSKVFPYISTNYSQSVEEKQRGVLIKERYFMLHTERIIFTDEKGDYIGHFVGESEDINTFYLRNAGLIPECRKKGLATSFLESFLKYLKDIGYARVTSQHHGTNHPVLIMMLKQGFNISGMELREEFGFLIKCTKHLNDERKNLFKKMTLGPGRSSN